MATAKTHWLVGILGAMVTAAAAAAAGVLVSRRLSAPDTAQNQQPPQLVPISLASSPRDQDIGGGWTLHDVTEFQSAIGKAKLRAGYDPGAIVTLVLSYKGGPPVAYTATVLNSLPAGDYAGSWTALKPPGGPQMVDFGPEHVLV